MLDALKILEEIDYPEEIIDNVKSFKDDAKKIVLSQSLSRSSVEVS